MPQTNPLNQLFLSGKFILGGGDIRHKLYGNPLKSPDPLYRKLFLRYCCVEHGFENALCYLCIDAYKKHPTFEKALALMDVFLLQEDSTILQVNLPSAPIEAAKKSKLDKMYAFNRLGTPEANLFDYEEKECDKNMMDTLGRFRLLRLKQEMKINVQQDVIGSLSGFKSRNQVSEALMELMHAGFNLKLIAGFDPVSGKL